MFRISFILMLCLFLSACGQMTSQSSYDPYGQTIINDGRMEPVQHQSAQQQSQIMGTPRGSANGRVAILLPLSGSQSGVGQSMLNAAQMALYDINDSGFELLPFDTKGTPQGASDAVRDLANQNIKLIIGPLLANNVAAAGQTARSYNLNVIGFTTDSTKAGGNVFTLGILPSNQGRRLANYAGNNNLRRIAIVTANTAYSNAVTSAFEQNARAIGIQIVDKIYLTDANQAAQNLNAKRGQFDAILMPIGNPQMASLSNALNTNGLSATNVTWLGAGLWDDSSTINNPSMRGAIFAAPAPDQRRNFESQYRNYYGQNPQRISSLAYDATALSIVLLRQNNRDISRQSIMNPNGFAGIDGIFRFESNGLSERGLAIHKIDGGGQTSIVSPAPLSFVN